MGGTEGERGGGVRQVQRQGGAHNYHYHRCIIFINIKVVLTSQDLPQYILNVFFIYLHSFPICYKFSGQVLKSALIRGVNCGEDYDHHYRRKSRMELTRVWHWHDLHDS